MIKITKKTIERIKAGYRDDLIDAIELLLDNYEEDKFDNGYKSCLADMSVRAYRLAEYIHKQSDKKGSLGKDRTGEPISYLEIEETANIIEKYFNKALKEE